MTARAATQTLIGWLGVALIACGGDIDNGPNGFGTGGGGGGLPGAGMTGGVAGGGAGTGLPVAGGGAGTGGAGDCTPELLPARAVLSPLRQYVNVLRDLFGEAAVSDEDFAATGEIEFEVIDRPRMTTASLDQVIRLAERATESLRGRTGSVIACNSLDDTACLRTQLTAIAARAFKRPPEQAEIDALLKVRTDALALDSAVTAEDATLLTLQAIATAPSTLYRTEFEGGAQATGYALTAHERAAALAAMLLDSVPDEQLMAAADSGALLDSAGLLAEIDRLLATPRVQGHLVQVVLSAFKMTKLFETPKDAAIFPEYSPALQASMYEESRLLVQDVLWTRKAAVGELLSARRSFVDENLAELYGVQYPGSPGSDDFVPIDLPPTRAGLLTQPGLMAVLSRTDKTSVVARGLFVRGALLCLPKVPPPPASVQAQVAEQLDADSSQEELAAYRAMTSPCSGCHSQFDRFGLLLENFDAIGRQRPQAAPGVDLTGLAGFMGEVAGPAELAGAIVEGGEFVDCMAERMLSYALSQTRDNAQSCLPAEVSATLHGGSGDIRALVAAIATHPAFAARSPQEP